MTLGKASSATRRLAVAMAIIAAAPSILFGFTTERSYLLLRSAREAGAPSTSAIRAWMTLDYVSGAYGVPVATLVDRLSLPRDTNPGGTLRTLAEQTGGAPFTFVQSVQKAIASAAPPAKSTASSGWLAWLTDSILSIVLTFGYSGYAAVRFLGSVGLPVPDGVATVLAGSLVELGRFDFVVAGSLGAIFATLGDLVGYGLGRWVGTHVIARYGGRFGMGAARLTSLTLTLDRWGVWAVFATRTIAASLGGLLNVVAGATRYSVSRFIGVSFVGRALWTGACLWLGYVVGADIDAAASLLRSLTGLFLSLLVFGASVMTWMRSRPTPIVLSGSP
jgi:membrane-associated protein